MGLIFDKQVKWVPYEFIAYEIVTAATAKICRFQIVLETIRPQRALHAGGRGRRWCICADGWQGVQVQRLWERA